MNRLALAAALLSLSAAASAEETQRPILVISPVAGLSQSASTAGALAGLYREEGRLRYGVTALATGGDARWGGASLDARWSLFAADFSPFVGAGFGAFDNWQRGVELGIQPSLTAEAGVEWGRFFAGGRMILPLSQRTSGLAAHDEGGVGSPLLLAQLGFSL